jgi:hypothetical protein
VLVHLYRCICMYIVYIYIYLLFTAIGLMPGGSVYKDHTFSKEAAPKSHLRVGTEENDERTSQDAGVPAEIRMEHLPNASSKLCCNTNLLQKTPRRIPSSGTKMQSTHSHAPICHLGLPRVSSLQIGRVKLCMNLSPSHACYTSSPSLNF